MERWSVGELESWSVGGRWGCGERVGGGEAVGCGLLLRGWDGRERVGRGRLR